MGLAILTSFTLMVLGCSRHGRLRHAGDATARHSTFGLDHAHPPPAGDATSRYGCRAHLSVNWTRPVVGAMDAPRWSDA
jgi:hypothetical protein